VLIDMAVVAYANAMRPQAMIGNTALIIESEMFRHKAGDRRTSKASRSRSTSHVSAINCCHYSTARERFEAIGRMQRMPAIRVERAKPAEIRLVAPWPGKTDGPGRRRAIRDILFKHAFA
jgi:hypothetical protein